MRALVLALLILGGLAAGLAIGLGLGVDADPPTEHDGPAPDGAIASVLEELQTVRARFERLSPPSGDEEDALRNPRTTPYRVHRERGQTLGVPRVTATAQIDEHVAAGRLVPLVDTEYYTVRTLEHSAPFITPDLKALLTINHIGIDRKTV